MSSVRKRKAMLKKLNFYFVKKGKLVSEREYSADYTAPYRITSIQKFLGGWSRMLNYLGFYYPQWADRGVSERKIWLTDPPKQPVKEVKPVKKEADPLDSLRNRAKSDEDE